MAAMLALALLGAAQDDGLKVGDAVPAFEGLDDQGKAWKSSEHLGKKVTVVFFYPAAFTGG